MKEFISPKLPINKRDSKNDDIGSQSVGRVEVYSNFFVKSKD